MLELGFVFIYVAQGSRRNGAVLAAGLVFKGRLEEKLEGSGYNGEITMMSTPNSHRQV